MKSDVGSDARKMFWSTEAGGTERCPQCKGELESEHRAYVVVIRLSGILDQFILGTDCGYFCVDCPTVVLEKERFAQVIEFGIGVSQEIEFVVMGTVDMAAIPADKRDAELGTDDNPIPLVEFMNLDQQCPSSIGESSKQPGRKPKRRWR
jgi:hypothetical protein